MSRTVSHHDYLMKYLTNPAKVAAYLNAVAEEGDIRFLLKALRNVVEARGGVGELAKITKLSRTSLYKTLSSKGNPEVGTLDAILEVYGIRIGFFPVVSDKSNHHRQSALRPMNGSVHYLTP